MKVSKKQRTVLLELTENEAEHIKVIAYNYHSTAEEDECADIDETTGVAERLEEKLESVS